MSKHITAEKNPNQPRIDQLMSDIEQLILEALRLDMDPYRLQLACQYWSGKYGKR